MTDQENDPPPLIRVTNTIAIVRAAFDLTLREAARPCRISSSTLAAIERGAVKVKPQEALAIIEEMAKLWEEREAPKRSARLARLFSSAMNK